MHVGLVMECDYREGRTQDEAFAEAMDIAGIAETEGLDGVWLAERHFAMHRRPTDPMGAGIPSIAAVPLVLGAAIAARTSRVRIGTGVSVLPLCHPIRTAEEAATVDQISKGRLDFGVGRSGFPRAYSGYGVRYDESRERFQESLDLILKAWTQEGFTHTGKYFTTDNLTVVGAWIGKGELNFPETKGEELHALAPRRIEAGFRYSLSYSVSDLKILEDHDS